MEPLAFALATLQQGRPCCLLQVVAHAGSSPGRTGFRMVVAVDGPAIGSIGGGMMEHKLTELARHRLRTSNGDALLKRQRHSADAPTDRSGMICSGEQTVLLFPLLPTRDAATLAAVVTGLADRHAGGFRVTARGLTVASATELPAAHAFAPPSTADAPDWVYAERFDPRLTVHVVGAGHVALACCELLHRLDFRLRLYDDRPDLPTLHQNSFADEQVVTPYEALAAHVGPVGSDHYAALMTFGYRTDAVALRQLLPLPFGFLGMLGSGAKVSQLLADLRAEGVTEAELARLHAPIGLPIGSQTPAEIAVSVAAQLIQVRRASGR